MSPTSEAIETAIRGLTGLPAEIPGTLTDAEACERIEQVEQLGRLVDSLRVDAAADIATRSRRELGEASLARRHGVSAPVLVEQLTRVSAAEATRRIRLGLRIAQRVSLAGEVLPADFERLATAMRAGEIGMDAAVIITKHLAEAGRRASITQLRKAEHQLVETAANDSADLVAVHARVWRQALDPDGAEPRDRRLRRQRRFVLGREVDGMTPFYGDADPVSAAQLRAWLGERTAPDRLPRFLDADDPEFDAREDGDAASLDPRSREQRSFDVLMGLLQAGVRADAATSTPLHSSANVMVVVREEELTSGTGIAWIGDVAEPISAASVNELICEAGFERVVIDHEGQPIALGRRERYYTAAQKRVLAVRDGGCVWPSCTAPPSWCHAHHIVEWRNGGRTDIDNGVLLCAFHHHLLHEGEFEMRMIRGKPHLRSPFRLDRSQQWRPVGRPRAALAG